MSLRMPMLAVTLVCLGCAPAPVPKFPARADQAPPGAASSIARPVASLDRTPEAVAPAPPPGLTTAGGGQIDATLATALAVIGLVALLALSDEICTGGGCAPEPAPAK